MRGTITLHASTFSGPGRPGDFAWMIAQPEYARALFVFNDNEEQFQAFHRGERSGCTEGGGNAAVRPHQCEDPPRAAGIPTGASGSGYTGLDGRVRQILDAALAHVRTLLETGRYTAVYYSDHAGDPKVLGHGIFAPGMDVLTYIPAQLEQIVAAVNAGGD